MNFINAFSELDKLYESVGVDLEVVEEEVQVEEAAEEAAEEVDAETEKDDEEVDIEIVDDEEESEEESDEEKTDLAETVVIECNNCGGIILKDKKDIVTDEETGAVNVDDACQYCEATKGFKVLGNFVPVAEDAEEKDEEVEGAEDLEEGLFGNKNKVDAEEIIGKYLPGMSDAQEIFNEVSYEIGSVLGNMIEKAKRETKKNSGMYATYKPLHDLIMDGRITKLIKKSDFLTPLRSIINTLEAVDGDAKLGKLKQYAEKIAELAKDKAAAGIMKELNKLSQKFLDGTLYDQKHALAWYDGAAV